MNDRAPGVSEDDDYEDWLTEEQRDALALGRNIAVTAGAGTGKTTTLEERYRHILRTEPSIDPTNIVTITFTRDATAELRAGIRDVIDQELDAADPTEYDRWRRAKDAVEDAYVHTIHGFCSRLLREFAVEAGLHPDFETLDETDTEVLVTAVAREVITAALEEDADADDLAIDGTRLATIEDDVRRLASLYERDELVSLLVGLVEERPESIVWAETILEQSEEEYVEGVINRVAPFGREETAKIAATDAVGESLATLRRLADLEFPFGPADDNGIGTLERLDDLLPPKDVNDVSTLRLQRLFLEVCDVVTSNDGAVYSQAHYYAGSATRWSDHAHADDNEALQEALGTLIDALEPARRETAFDLEAARMSVPYVFAIARLYELVRTEYRNRKARRNALDYSDLIETTVEFLETNEEPRRELQEQFRHVMLDEIQDTDPRQWELVRLLSGADPSRIDGRNVFVVGDEKQSIYRFRQADVTMVRRAESELAAANPDDTEAAAELSGNFRTLAGPLAFLNDLFDRVFEAEDPEVGHRPDEAEAQRLTATRTVGTDIDGSVEYLLTPERDEDLAPLGLEDSWLADRTFATSADREAAAIAARLTRLFADPPDVYDTESNQTRAAKPRDVALLFRSTTRLRAFERALEDADIPYTSVGGQSLYETPEIEPLVNLLEVLQQPSREIPLYGVLRSPLFGFTDDELAGLYHPEASLWERLQAADGRLGEAGARLQAWRSACGVGDEHQSTKWGQFISRVIAETGYLVGIGADERPTQAVVNVNQFREQLRQWEEGAALPLADVLTRIQRDRTHGDQAGEGDVPTDIQGVQLRTVHSAKGLEFPVVVVPELGRGAGGQATVTYDGGRFPRDLAYFEEVDDEPVLGIKGPDPTNPITTTKTPDWDLAAAIQDRAERAEAKRVLYVAATRARDHLILSSTHRLDDETEAAFEDAPPRDEAECWRDWLQPILLEDRGILAALRTEGWAKAQLDGSQYTVSLPPAPRPGPGASTGGSEAFDLEIPSPDPQTRKRLVSATDLQGARFDGEAEPQKDQTPGSSDEGEFFGGPYTHAEIEPTEFGTLVHRLCELAVSGVEIDWNEHPRRLVGNPDRLTGTDIERARDHTEAAVARIDELVKSLEVLATYDELRVRLSLENAEVVGDIDHLCVTEEAYYVTDYKTDSLAGYDPDTLAEAYWPQLQVYACALQQASPRQKIGLRLVFTETNQLLTRSLDQSEIAEARNELERYLRRANR